MAEDKKLEIEMLRRMLRIRYFEERVIELLMSGDIVGWVHPYIGEEAVAVGVCLALREDDYIVGTHRSHGHPIGKGASLKRALAELMGRETGYSKGKGGSMHMADFSIGILGESGIVGSSMPVGVGAGLANKLRKIDRVSVCFFGDGASCEGSFHESVNLASIWKLPVVFVCENNQYAITTPYRYSIPVENIADRAVAYNIPGVLVDGQNVIAMYEATKTAVERARSGHGPTLIEGKTYRYFDHSIATTKIVRKPYRTEEEVEHWKKNRDPIQIHKEHILRNKIATEDEFRQIDEAVKKEIKEAEEFARKSPYPKPEELFEDLFANPIPLE